MIQNMLRQMPPVTKNLLLINVLIFVAMLVPPLGASLERMCALYYFESPAFRPWQPVTYMFLHGGFAHLFFNMFALVMFGGIIEWTLGSRRFLFFYMVCGIGAALVQEGVYALMLTKYQGMFDPVTYRHIIDSGYQLLQSGRIFTDPTMAKMTLLVNMPTVGASGAIYGVLLAFGMLYPNREIYIMFIPFGIKAKWAVAGYAVLELLMGLGSTGDGIAHFAHLGGMVFGLFLLLYWKRKGVFNGWY